jgi:ubiquinone/menaquinone biosynthesis C-methylase UbiE
MSTDVKFAGSVPTLYERHLGPIMFAPYATDTASRLSDLRSGSLLELAAGTGAVTRELARVLPPEVRIVATDLNQGMLDIAAARPIARSVAWKQADLRKLPFGDREFDAAVCQFGVMFLPDKVAAHREVRRVLVPGGRFLFAVWDRLDANPLSLVGAREVARLFSHDPPDFFERMPFGYHDARAIREEVERAGFTHVDVEVVEKVVPATSEGAAIGLCQGTPLRGEIEARAPERLEEVTEAVRVALEAHYGGKTFEHRMSALVVTARA